LQAVEIELQQLSEPREVDTLFFGGGTPTHLSEDQLARLIALVRRWFVLAPGGEFSVEANPSRTQSASLCAGGGTRISLGGQSFDPSKLTILERDHSPEQLESELRFWTLQSTCSTSLDL